MRLTPGTLNADSRAMVTSTSGATVVFPVCFLQSLFLSLLLLALRCLAEGRGEGYIIAMPPSTPRT
jgi:hypothetical protein